MRTFASLSLRVGFLFFAMFAAAQAKANLQVYPTRIVLNDQKRVGQLSLRHMGDKEESYKATAVFYRMKPDGSFEETAQPTEAEHPLGKYLRFSPRRVTLKPQQEQVIRIMYSGPAGLPEGEYRAHIHLVPDGETPEAKPSAKAKADTIKMELSVKIAFAVPVLFRRGNPTFDAKLEKVRMLQPSEGSSNLALDVNWTGTAWPYGDFEAFFTPKGGERRSVGLVRGIASYLSPRTVVVPLTAARDTLHNGKMEVVFRTSEDDGAKTIQTVETAFP